MTGRATRSKPNVALRSPLKPVTRTTKENAASRKRARSPTPNDAPAKRAKQESSSTPLSPKNGEASSLPAIEPMVLDAPPPPPPPKTPGTLSRLPMPSSTRKPFLGFKSSSRPLFLASGTTPAKPKGPLTRGANIRRYKQPPPKLPPPKETAIFAKKVETSVPVDTAREMQASLSRLDEALKKLAAPRPPPRRPASSLGFSRPDEPSASGVTSSPKPASSSDAHPARPGTSLGFTSPSKIPTAARRLETIPGSPTRPSLAAPEAPVFHPTTPTRVVSASALPVPASVSRRASAASRGLSRTLSELPAPPTLNSFIRSKKEGPSSDDKTRIQPTRAPSSRIAAIKASQPETEPAEQRPKPKEKDAEPHLDVLKHCTIFVDVRTDEGDDAAALFVDMLRGLGARILTRMSTRLTHIVFKSGLPGTVARYRMLTEPRPRVVGIGWVVECVEKRERVDEDRFSVDLETAETKQKRKANAPLNPVRPRKLQLPDAEDEEPDEGLTMADESFLEFSFEKSILGVNVPSSASKEPAKEKGPKQREIRDFFTPIGRKSGSGSGFRPRVGSPLRETFSLPGDADDEDEDVVMLGA